MKLQVKKDLMHKAEKFTLKDHNHNPIITLQNMMPMLGNKICVFDSNDKEVLFIDRANQEEEHTFVIHKNFTNVATVVRKDGLLRKTFDISSDIGEAELKTRGSDYFAQLFVDSNPALCVQNSYTVDNDKAYDIEIFDTDNKELLLSILYATLILSDEH